MPITELTPPQVTIAIPTYNRAELLSASLRSALDQKYPDFEILVLDNASTDNTEAVVESFGDRRVRYVRSPKNIGLFRNWNRAIELNRSPYLGILQDDDALLPDFIQESVAALERNPTTALSFTLADGIDLNNAPVPLPGEYPRSGLIPGTEYLCGIVNGANWVIQPSTVLMRSSVIDEVGPFDNPHSSHSIDINLYYRMMVSYDVVLIPRVLSRVRVHAGQDSQRRFGSSRGTGPLATMAERSDAVAHLLESDRAADPSFRHWLADRLFHLSMRRSALTQEFVPELNLSWKERIEIVKNEVMTLIGPGETFILVDEGEWGAEIAPGRRVIPFLERDGCYWGVPTEDRTAIRELERLRGMGARYVVFGWPAFWWLDYYSGLRDHLRSRYPCVLSNSRLVAYDLEGGREQADEARDAVKSFVE
ncbi:MAG: glycosyltransferase family A protein [Gammaproteobacteria bacterium]|jgi:glycosyltransferase involved in cell wall biosynthesis